MPRWSYFCSAFLLVHSPPHGLHYSSVCCGIGHRSCIILPRSPYAGLYLSACHRNILQIGWSNYRRCPITDTHIGFLHLRSSMDELWLIASRFQVSRSKGASKAQGDDSERTAHNYPDTFGLIAEQPGYRVKQVGIGVGIGIGLEIKMFKVLYGF